MLRGFYFFCVLLGLFTLSAVNATPIMHTKVEGIKISQEGGKTLIHFAFNQAPQTAPEVLAKGNILQFTFKNVIIWPKIEKQVNLGNVNVQLLAYQYNKDEVRVRTIFPHELPVNFTNQVNVGTLAKEMNIALSSGNTSNKVADVASTGTSEIPAGAEKFDEKYLEKLGRDSASASTTIDAGKKDNTAIKNFTDKVKARSSSTDRANSGFALTKYILKFSAFLGLVLVLFYGIVSLFKRGVLGKNKLGLLTTKEGVVVLSTTHIAPKKTLLLVKAHTQVFLLANTDTGINLISEIQNVPTLIKSGERETTGTNFDTTLSESHAHEQEFKMKDGQIEAANRDAAKAPVEKASLAAFLEERPVVDEVKVSDKIKSKVKSLRAFQ